MATINSDATLKLRRASRMTVIEHLTELRRRVITSIVAVIAAAALCYWFAPDVIRFFLHYYRDVTHGQRHAFVFTGPLDAFTTRLKVAIYGGIVVALPVWLFEMWRFITPGLNSKERRYAIPFLLSSVLLFAFGALMALVTLPEALHFLIHAGGSELQPLLTADRYLSLVLLMILAFGLAFEFPVILVFLLVARVLSTATLRRRRRWAIVGVFAFAAVITPSQDPYSLIFMAVPMCLFYEASILIGRLLNR